MWFDRDDDDDVDASAAGNVTPPFRDELNLDSDLYKASFPKSLSEKGNSAVCGH